MSALVAAVVVGLAAAVVGAAGAGLVVRSRRGTETARRTRLLVTTVVEAMQADRPGAADASVEVLARTVGADAAGIGVVGIGADDDELMLRGCWNLRETARHRPVRRGEGVAGRVWATGRPRLLPDLAADAAHIPDAEGMRSAIYLPGVSGGQVLVVLGLESRRRRAFTDAHVRLLTPVADLLAAAEDSRRQLRDAQLREDRLLVGVGTQLRGPLTGVVGNLSTLERYGERVEGTTGDELLGAASRATARISRLLDALTLAGRLGAGGVQPTMEPVAAWDVLDGALHRLRQEMVEPSVLAEGLAGARPVLADREQLVTALTELVHNALWHGQGATVTVLAETRGSSQALIVRDDGPGIAPGVLDTTLRARRGEPSLNRGLGLTLATRLVETMHGTVSVRSRPGQGTTAEILLPLAPA